MTRRPALSACLAIVLLWAVHVRAQDAPAQAPQATDPPAHISVVDGAAVLERDGQSDPASASMPLLAGDRIRTQGGRVEVLFADGSSLHLDANTLVDFQSDEVIRLLDGRVRLHIAGPARRLSYRVDAPSAWVQIGQPGEFRVALLRGDREPQVELAVLRGYAELTNEDGRSEVRAGERAFARAGAAPSAPYVYNSAAWDAFDRWSEARRDERLGASAQYLPQDVRAYSRTFDTYGSWRYEQVYDSYVWYPRVAVGWRPYYYGHWASLRPYGWTWIASDPWGWPTHHYGRWGFSAGVWFWIPGRHWGPAWVSWAYSPGYVSWCPLGWNNRPIVQFVNVNIYGGRHHDPWDAWTVVPYRHFDHRGRYRSVHLDSVAGSRFDNRTRESFRVRDRAPDARVAVPRGGSAIRTAGAPPSRSGLGGVAPVYTPPAGAGTANAQPRDRVPPFVRSAAPSRSVAPTRGFPDPARRPGTAVGSPEASAASGNGNRSTGAAVPRGAVPRVQSPGAGAPAASRLQGTRSAGTAPQYRAAPQSRAASPEQTRPPASVRAVPRQDSSRSAPAFDRSSGSAPAVGRDAPYRSAPYRPDASPRPDSRYRSQAPVREPYQPVPNYQPPDNGSRRAPESYRAPESHRAPEVSRPAPRGDSMPIPSYRSGPQRRGPDGPPPRTSAPSRPSGSSGGTAPQSRPRGGGQSSGSAVRRPGG
jgi:hypothetical protein